MAKPAQEDVLSLFSGLTDEQVDALYNRLSGPITAQEQSGAGLGGGYTPGGMSGSMKTVDDFMNFGGKSLGLKHGLTFSPMMLGYHAYRLHGKSKADMARKRAADAAQREAHRDYKQLRTQRLEQVKAELQRRQLKRRVNGYFNSESMQGLYDTLQDNHLKNSLSQITQQYGDQLRQSAFQTAGQGLTGSSVDAERRGQVQQAQNAEAIQAQAAAQQFAQSARSNNEQQRQALIGTISSGNPYQGAALDQQLQGISNQTNAMASQYANQTAQNEINQYGYNMQSQALGNLLSNYANLYRMNGAQ